jgi:serine/threonine protein kinase
MDRDRWRRVGELYHSALQIAEDQRAAFLCGECQGDEELRREVESLLLYESAASEFIESPAFDLAAQLIAKDQANEQNQNPIVGAVSPRFRLLEKLGRGGMGVVYKAEDTKLRRSVALKFLPPEFSRDLRALERFQREAYAASALNHPNICTVHDVDEYQGHPFIAMELLEGQTLDLRIAERTMPTPELLDYAIQICDGLDAAHRKSMIHRDIKPSNIFLSTHGQAKILDFGLAKLQDFEIQNQEQASGEPQPAQEWNSNSTLTRTGVAIGTAGYMSPEQIRGEKLDMRTDLFSFGLVLYEMATGRRAFEGDTGSAVRNAILTQTPVPAQQLNSRLPVRLEAIIRKALEKDRDARYHTASQMRAELESVRREIAARTLPQRWILASAVLVALLVGGAVIWFAKRPPSSQQPKSEIKFRQLTINSSENSVSSGSISPNGRYLAYVDTQGVHVKDIETGETTAVSEPAEIKKDTVEWQIVSAGWLSDNTQFVANANLREGADTSSQPSTSIWLFSRLGNSPRKLRERANAWSVSPDGSSIAFGTNIGKLERTRELWLMAPDGGQARQLFQANENGSIEFRLWSPDGQHGLSLRGDSSGDTVVSIGLTSEPPTTAFKFDDWKKPPRGDLSWLPDGRLVYPAVESGFDQPEISSALATCNFWTVRVDIHNGKPLEELRRLPNWTGFCIGSANSTADGKQLRFSAKFDPKHGLHR